MEGEIVTRLRVGTTVDAWNNTIPGDWADADRSDIPGCAVAPHGSTVDNISRNEVATSLDVYTPAGVEILPTDRLEVRGEAYEVVGDPADWRSPYSGTQAGLVVNVKRVEG
jgi:hypothetical protein